MLLFRAQLLLLALFKLFLQLIALPLQHVKVVGKVFQLLFVLGVQTHVLVQLGAADLPAVHDLAGLCLLLLALRLTEFSLLFP